MVFTDYADIYSAYKNKNYFALFYDYVGSLVILLTLIGFAIMLLQRQTREICLVLILSFIISSILIDRVATFSEHHFYLFFPTIVIFISFIATYIFVKVKNPIFRYFCISVYLLVLVFNFSYVFFPSFAQHFRTIRIFLPQITYLPLVRDDMAEIRHLLKILNETAISENDRIYVLASSTILNDDILRKGCYQFKYDPKLCRKFLRTSHVDKKDGFPTQIFTANYVILANPMQFHLNPNDQRVIGILGDAIANQKNIGSSYKRLPFEFKLDRGVNVYLYEKLKDLERSDVELLSRHFSQYYEGRENFRLPDISPQIK